MQNILISIFHNMKIKIICQLLPKWPLDNKNSLDDKMFQYLCTRLFPLGINTKMCKGFMTPLLSSKINPSKDFLQFFQPGEELRRYVMNNCITHWNGALPGSVFLLNCTVIFPMVPSSSVLGSGWLEYRLHSHYKKAFEIYICLIFLFSHLVLSY